MKVMKYQSFEYPSTESRSYTFEKRCNVIPGDS